MLSRSNNVIYDFSANIIPKPQVMAMSKKKNKDKLSRALDSWKRLNDWALYDKPLFDESKKEE